MAPGATGIVTCPGHGGTGAPGVVTCPGRSGAGTTLAGAVLSELGQINTLHKANVERAGFAVLKAPDVPSILVETAFISNPQEERRLKDERYQDKMARAILGGINRYFSMHPPRPQGPLAQK